MRRRWAVLLLASSVMAADTSKERRDDVPNEKTALRIAEAVLIAQFGEERVKAQLPLRASNSYRDTWIVQGTEPGPPQKGGGMAVMIDKHSGRIVNVLEHMK